MNPDQRTTRFVREMATALRVKEEAQKRGHNLSLEQAHQCWAEYSDDYCAGWLVFDAADPVAEIWRAITRWEAAKR